MTDDLAHFLHSTPVVSLPSAKQNQAPEQTDYTIFITPWIIHAARPITIMPTRQRTLRVRGYNARTVTF